MQAKDKFLEKINILIFIISLCFPRYLYAENIYEKIFNYNDSLKNSSAHFIQTNTNYLQEGLIFFGDKRIKINYDKPQKLTIILSEKKGVYINHDLKESEFFFTKKSYIKIFFDIFNKKNYLKKMTIDSYDDQIKISEKIKLDNSMFDISLIYENDPIKLRRLEIISDDENIQMGFFDHNMEDVFGKNFFSMVDPYLN
jgi:outer membrane lipoprotein-sorting protein